MKLVQLRRFASRIRSLHSAVRLRHREFVAGLPRLRRIDSSRDRLPLVLRRQPAPLPTQRTAVLFATFRPTCRIALAWNVRTPRPDARIFAMRVVTHTRTRAIATPHYAIERLHRNVHSVERLVRSLPPPPRIRTRREGDARGSFARVQTTMLRSRTPQPAADPAAPASGAPRSNQAERPRAFATPRPSAPPPLPPAELSRVTEHVIRQLDRRVLSYRERTGQVWGF